MTKWSTHDEIKFIENLGKNRSRKYESIILGVRKYLLWRNYLISSENRKEWGVLNKKKIVDHVTNLIRIQERTAILYFKNRGLNKEDLGILYVPKNLRRYVH